MSTYTNKNEDEISIIKCPYCGREYLPAEIFYPQAFLGRPHNIVRKDNTTIVSFMGDTMNLQEDYICDNCDKKFKAIAKVDFKTVETDKFSMDNTYVTKLFDEKITLSEDI